MVFRRKVESLEESCRRCLPLYIKNVFIETWTYLEMMLIKITHSSVACNCSKQHDIGKHLLMDSIEQSP